MNFYKVVDKAVKETLIKKYFTIPAQFSKNLSAFKKLFGEDVNRLKCDANELVFNSLAVNPNLWEQFIKNYNKLCGGYVAKKKSQIRKQYLDLCKKLNIEQIYGYGVAYLIDQNLTMESRRISYLDEINEIIIRCNSYKITTDKVKEIKESDYYKLKARNAKQKEILKCQ
jgi:hypothetical protein